MDRRTFRVQIALFTVLATAGLSACNDTGFSLSEGGKLELDKLNPQPSPEPSSVPSSVPSPHPSVTPVPSVTPSPSVTPLPSVTPSPSATPHPSATPSPSVTPAPSATPSPTPTVPVVTSKAQQDAFNVSANIVPKVDMLFCVDNSGSMADKQQVLADSVNTFIGQFVARGIDFHIGIVTTDVASSTSSYWTSRLPSYLSPNRGRLESRYWDRYLTSNSASVVDKFKANAKVGTSGDGNEQCFNSMLYALDDTMIGAGGFNENFVREDALLSMIVVSDEDESVGSDSAHKGETVDGLIARMKSRLAAVKGANSRGYSFDFVINKTAAKPAKIVYPLTNGTNYYPNFYFAAATAFVANTYDVLKNFGADLAKIGGDIINQAEKEYKLSQKPVAGSLVVKIDGDVIAADAAEGYIYHADRNTIELVGDALEASPGRRVTIDYKFAL